MICRQSALLGLSVIVNYAFVLSESTQQLILARKMARLRFPTFRLARHQPLGRDVTRFRQRLIVGFWILVLAVSLIGWLVALAWTAYQLIRHLVS